MKSMTGFGRATAPLGGGNVVVQVNSVNRKTFDLSVRMPEPWSGMEPKVASAARKVAARGKIHVQIGLEGSASGEAQLETSLARMRGIAAANNLPFEPDAKLLWDMVNDRRTAAEPELDETVEAALLKATEEALQSFAGMRATEGKALLTDFLTRIETIKGHVVAVTERSPQVVADYRENLIKRLRDADLELDVEDERVLKEVCLFADRCDITEEITRLDSHLDQFEGHLKGDGEIGRKAEFILQEIGREIHTIGSKANDLQLSKHVIELKNEMERIREQIANVE